MMARILSKGTIAKADPWYRRTPWECPSCGTVWVVEDGDVVETWADRQPDTGMFAATACPLCRRMVTIGSEKEGAW